MVRGSSAVSVSPFADASSPIGSAAWRTSDVQAHWLTQLGQQPGVLSAQEEELLGEPLHPLFLLQNVFQESAVLIRLAGTAECHLGGVVDHGQGSTQFMGCVGREATGLLEGSL